MTIRKERGEEFDGWHGILTGNARGIGILVGDLHVFHESLAADAQFVTDWTAGGAGTADEGVVLLEHDTLLQLLFWWF